MRYTDVRSRNAVKSAIRECDLVGREEFRDRYGRFEASRTYFLRYEGKEYDSKPIIAVAHKYQHPDEGPLSKEFSGGKDHAARQLARLGFDVDGVHVGASDWTLGEVETVVEDYFEMFDRIRAGDQVNKAARIRALVSRIPARNEGAIGRKQGNISAVLEKLELPWTPGIRPLRNVQLLLEAVVYDWIADHPDFFSEVHQRPRKPAEATQLEVEPPTNLHLVTVARERRATRVDFAARDERNRELGREGELWALGRLKEELIAAGRDDLAQNVKWVSDDVGDGLGYDIASFDGSGQPVFVEVKTTNGAVGSPFLLTPNEIAASEAVESFILMRIFDFGGTPRFYRLRGRLRDCCQLEPQLFRALPRA